MSDVKVTVGRVVYFKTGPVDRAAIVVDVRSGEDPAQQNDVRLFVMNPDAEQGTSMFTDWVKQGQEDGQWDWMPFQKDQQARLATDETEKTV